ncbi:MFS transporter [Diaminobutyricibacter tongyongensis]|uniref:MFS transporter n=1 Tax=Leifsonia tongyongensis TaxID=1268043 RepID=A0A6L9XTI7_9MICO|nr:MFS transporter [Diaminobutyricibacter tongyongensis]NEN04585.1 MFS transporter [Diaminobutyricibacter tongyongensis]
MTEPIVGPPEVLWTRDFARLWWSEAISFFGSQLTLFAMPIVALQTLHASAADVAWINTAAGLGTLVFLGLLGPWTDRSRRTRFMSLMSLLRAVLLAAVAALFLMHSLSLLALVIAAGLISGLTGLYDSAFSALLLGITPRSTLPSANTWVSGIRSAGDIGAGATAGILLHVFSPLALFIADAVSYLASAITLSRIREAAPERAARLTVRSYARSLSSGFCQLYLNPVIWPVNLSIAHFNLFTTAIQAIYITHALRSGTMSPAEIGIAGALGGLLGLATMSIAPRMWNRFRPIAVLTVTFALPAFAGLGMLLLAPSQPFLNVALLGLSLGFWASCVMINITGTETLKQVLVPERTLGRVSAASRVLTWGIDPVGAALAGVLTFFLPTGAVLTISALGVLTSAIWVIAARAVRELPRLPEVAVPREG